jgi:hypothetical protein
MALIKILRGRDKFWVSMNITEYMEEEPDTQGFDKAV